MTKMRISEKFKSKCRRLFITFLFFFCELSLFVGISIAYTNSKALAFDDNSGIVSLEKGDEGDIIADVFGKKINVSDLLEDIIK